MAALNRLQISLQQIDLRQNSSLPAALTQQTMDLAALQSALLQTYKVLRDHEISVWQSRHSLPHEWHVGAS